MRRFCKDIPAVGISCILFDKQYLEQYKIGYNAAFRPMREALNIKPYDWYHDSNKILDKSSDIYFLVEDENGKVGAFSIHGKCLLPVKYENIHFDEKNNKLVGN